MSQNLTTQQKGQATTTPSQNVANPEATKDKSQEVITLNAIEVKAKLSVQDIFAKFEQGRAMREIYDRYVLRQKELVDFEAEASDESGFVLRSSLKSGRGIEFLHTPSNLDFVREQIRKNDANIKSMEEKIQEFSALFSIVSQ